MPGPIADYGIENPAGLAWVPRSIADGRLGGIPLIVGIVLAFIQLGVRYRRAGTVERAQIRWLMVPLIALFVALVANSVVRIAPALITPTGQVALFFLVPLAFFTLPVSMGIAILRYRLFDIDLIIKRTVVYGATSTAIGVVFFAGVVALQALLGPLVSGSEAAVAASTLVSFALFQPIRRRMQDLVDRRFDHSASDAARTLETFADRLRDQVDLDTLRADLLGAVSHTMAPAHASLWLRKRAP